MGEDDIDIFDFLVVCFPRCKYNIYKTYSNPAEWYTLKNPVLPSSTRGTLTRIFIEVAFNRSYVNGIGEGDSDGRAGPKIDYMI